MNRRQCGTESESSKDHPAVELADPPAAQMVEVLFLERGEHQLAGHWQPEGQAASRLLRGFKVPVRALFGSAISVKGENPLRQK